MKCHNRQIGEIEYANDHVFTFAEGLFGFDQLRTFIVINDAEAEPFRWLVSVEDEDVCLPLLDPKFILPEYELLNRFTEGATVAVVASLKEPIEESTVNLRSPLVFDAVARTGEQVILPDERFSVQQQFLRQPEAAPAIVPDVVAAGE
jgi:flagellar assembly factor FliW